MGARLGDECFACRWCRYNPDYRVLWCYLKRKDALRRCDQYVREPGADD